ncbi:hypothetical protein LOZ80_36805 [Paenibacillus sp. HWE-109]|uniref:hypothetical protein n=1 Tax=Paenibacillus sp. HWE-109 TaxID=1306526 RepID=UPI001EDF3073|nr:hypothetical protein [Paenibacillus sp. HWE-109]UKS26963.1 hypothetical protein LOZ80_36805 [Paenibacillus sp. HWE-109]
MVEVIFLTSERKPATHTAAYSAALRLFFSLTEWPMSVWRSLTLKFSVTVGGRSFSQDSAALRLFFSLTEWRMGVWRSLTLKFSVTVGGGEALPRIRQR